MILTDDEIDSVYSRLRGDTFEQALRSVDFARAIEQAILEKMGDPVAWMMVNETCPSLTPTLCFEPKTDWHITWKAVPLYALPEVKE